MIGTWVRRDPPTQVEISAADDNSFTVVTRFSDDRAIAAKFGPNVVSVFIDLMSKNGYRESRP